MKTENLDAWSRKIGRNSEFDFGISKLEQDFEDEVVRSIITEPTTSNKIYHAIIWDKDGLKEEGNSVSTCSDPFSKEYKPICTYPFYGGILPGSPLFNPNNNELVGIYSRPSIKDWGWFYDYQKPDVFANFKHGKEWIESQIEN